MPIFVPKGKLTAQQWYESDLELLAAEKAAMQRAFPNFQLDELDDGSLCWLGELDFGFLADNKWTIRAVYNYDHPKRDCGCSIRIYFVNPDIDELKELYGKIPFPVCLDSDNNYYLKTYSIDEPNDCSVLTAASVMCHVVMILIAFELCLNGDLTREEYEEGWIRF